MSFHTNLEPGDKPAAFTGLIVGAVVAAAFMYGIVLWTNTRFEGHSTGGAAAAAPAAQH